MIGFEFDTGGAKPRKGIGTDCAVRAIAIVTGLDYQTVYGWAGDEVLAAQKRARTFRGKPSRSLRNGVGGAAWRRLAAKAGLVKVSLPKGVRPTFTEAHERYGDYVVQTTGHVAALKDGALRDNNDIRTYEWEDEYGFLDLRERKAVSVWVKA